MKASIGGLSPFQGKFGFLSLFERLSAFHRSMSFKEEAEARSSNRSNSGAHVPEEARGVKVIGRHATICARPAWAG
jgi:hypothetical protein